MTTVEFVQQALSGMQHIEREIIAQVRVPGAS
jgi:hypothetical protein